MKQTPIQEILSSDRKNSYGMILWRLGLLGLIFGGGMLALLEVWGAEILTAVNEPYTVMGAVLSAMGGTLCLVLANPLEKKFRAAGFLRLFPWIVLVFLTTPASIGRGMSAWINGIIDGWNRMHDGGIPLLSYSASVDDGGLC